MTNEVLTDEELALVAEQKRRIDLLASMDVHLKEPAEMLALVNRLAVEVEFQRRQIEVKDECISELDANVKRLRRRLDASEAEVFSEAEDE